MVVAIHDAPLVLTTQDTCLLITSQIRLARQHDVRHDDFGVLRELRDAQHEQDGQALSVGQIPAVSHASRVIAVGIAVAKREFTYDEIWRYEGFITTVQQKAGISWRPATELAARHVPGPQQVKPDELSARDLPTHVEVVAYCRGPFCVFADEAVRLLSQHAIRAAGCKTVFRNGDAPGYASRSASTPQH